MSASTSRVDDTLTFFINSFQMNLNDLDEKTDHQLRNNDEYAVNYINELIRLGMLPITEDIHSIVRSDLNGPTILFERHEQDDSINESILSDTMPDELSQSLVDQSASSASGLAWSDEESRFLLDRYEKYLGLVGPMKKFKTKKIMWLTIGSELEKQFSVHRTAQQIENRFKTILKRKKKANIENQRTGNIRHEIPFENELHKIAAIDDSIEPEILRGVNVVIKKTEKEKMPLKEKRNTTSTVLRETLLEMNRIKEEGRNKRHQEKMDLLKQLIEKGPK